MDRIPFKQLPMIVKMAVWLVFNNAWWSLEEFVIDRLGMWKYMPYYKVANACVWDLAVATITALAVWRASAVHGALMPAGAGYSVAGRKCTARAVLAAEV